MFYAECHYAECRGAFKTFAVFLQVSSVQYEPPNPGKGVNFFNFKPLQDGQRDLQDKTGNLKRDQPVDPNKFPSFFNSDVIDEEIQNFQEKLKIENQESQILFRKNENSIDFDQAIKAS